MPNDVVKIFMLLYNRDIAGERLGSKHNGRAAGMEEQAQPEAVADRLARPGA
jgi:hypothetical protein